MKVISPDIKQILMGHLATLGVRVYSTRPNTTPPAEFIVVVNTGGPGRVERVLQTAQMTVSSYAESTGGAFNLANRVESLILSLPSDPESPIAAIPMSVAPNDSPDPDTGQARYVATYQLTATCRQEA